MPFILLPSTITTLPEALVSSLLFTFSIIVPTLFAEASSSLEIN